MDTTRKSARLEGKKKVDYESVATGEKSTKPFEDTPVSPGKKGEIPSKISTTPIPLPQNVPESNDRKRKERAPEVPNPYTYVYRRPRRKRKVIKNQDFIQINDSEVEETSYRTRTSKSKKDDEGEYIFNPDEENEDDYKINGRTILRPFAKALEKDPHGEYVVHDDDLDEDDEDDDEIELEKEEELDLRTTFFLPDVNLDMKQRKGYSLRDPKPEKRGETPRTILKKKKRTKESLRYDKLRKQHVSSQRRNLNQNMNISFDFDSDDDDDDDFRRTARGGGGRRGDPDTYTKIAPLNSRFGRKGMRADTDPVPIDRSITFDSIGGLKEHIKLLKEMIYLPILYPEVYTHLKITPPRGVLFVGPPGTGKTLVARALANQCQIDDYQEISFFMRKGADILSKWVGEAEKQLRLLFEKARQMEPSIIFFDELDGLAPVRSSKQDYIHSSIVSTLLALMDGLDERGQVIVIGATNRVDSIDPALRRPGRFDREFFFDLPNQVDRKEILDIHTKKWEPKVPLDLRIHLSQLTVGYSGADLKNLCTESALGALRRTVPQIYSSGQKLVVDLKKIKVERVDWENSLSKITPTSYKTSVFHPQPLPFYWEPLLRPTLNALKKYVQEIFPFVKFSRKKSEKIGKNTALTFKPWVLIKGKKGNAHNQLVKALLHENLEHFRIFDISLENLITQVKSTMEESLVTILKTAKSAAPCIVVLPNISSWWNNCSQLGKNLFVSFFENVPNSLPLFFITTLMHDRIDVLPQKLQDLFKSNVVSLTEPGGVQRKRFFDIVMNAVTIPVLKKGPKKKLPKLPKAQSSMTVGQQEILLQRTVKKHQEVRMELKIFLYKIITKLIGDRTFQLFKIPKDTYSFIDDTFGDNQRPDKLVYLYDILDNNNNLKYSTSEEFLLDCQFIAKYAKYYKIDYDRHDKETNRKMHGLGQQFFDTCQFLVRKMIPEMLIKECLALPGNREKQKKLKDEIEREKKRIEERKLTPIKKKIIPDDDDEFFKAVTGEEPPVVEKDLEEEIFPEDLPRAPPARSLKVRLRPRREKKEKKKEDEEYDSIVVNKKLLEEFFKEVLHKTEGYTIVMLERVYVTLNQVLYSFRKESNRIEIIDQMKKALENINFTVQ